jgi:biopolymer transport protein ExbD
MKLSPIQKRAERASRNQSLVDLNLVSLIDIFTILIFFLLANASEVEVLPSAKAVRLPESTAEKGDGDLIEPLRAELAYEAGRVMIRKEKETKSKALTIMGDREIPYRLLRKIMVTCARANYGDLSFAVIEKGKA